MEDIKKKTQVKLLEIKIIMYEMKNTLNEINIRLDIPERKKKKDWRILRHSNRNREKTIKKLNRVAVCCETTSRSLITCN